MKPSVRRAPEGAFRYVRGIMDKPFKTYTELLDFLEKEKRLSILDRTMAEEILSKTGYYSLITGCKELFKDKTTGYYRLPPLLKQRGRTLHQKKKMSSRSWLNP